MLSKFSAHCYQAPFVVFSWIASGGILGAAAPTVDYALSLKPLQEDVSYDVPAATEIANCKVSPENLGKASGWTVHDGNGQILRMFLDSNSDNKVDRWSYFKDGIEIYRDIDSNGNGKVDEHRWLNLAGTRWAIDKNEDGEIDAWTAISAEEVSAEILVALRDKDWKRFERVMLTPEELKALNLPEPRAKEIEAKLAQAKAEFRKLAARQKEVTAKASWVQFSANRPGAVPSQLQDGSDLMVYENSLAMYEENGKSGYLQIGTLIRQGDTWRAIDLPRLMDESADENAASGFFFTSSFSPSGSSSSTPVPGSPTEAVQKLLADLEKLDDQSSRAASPQELASVHARRATILAGLIDASTPVERASWIRQMADTVSAAVQSGEFPTGLETLDALITKLKKNDAPQDLMAYVAFRQIMAKYVLDMQGENPDFAKIQDDWLKQLERFVNEYSHAPDAAEAMLQLANTYEFATNDNEAVRWYGRIVQEFPNTPAAEKAAGAKRRLESVGKPMELRGTTVDGKTVDLRSYRNKVVLIHYWASWSDLCRADLAQLKELYAKYGRRGFAIIGVSLDHDSQELQQFLQRNRLPWVQVFEVGGLEGRLANEMGILTLPTMVLVDTAGRVSHRGVHLSELDGILNQQLK